MNKIYVDLDALLAAFEYSSDAINYYLDMETGHVLMALTEVQWELEAIYEEFYDPNAPEHFNMPNILQQRHLPEWRQQALLQAHAIEQGYLTRYLDVPKSDSSAAYNDMHTFINTLEDKDLRQKLWRAISGQGAFRQFKDAMAEHPTLRKHWLGFSAEQARQRVQTWLTHEGIEWGEPEGTPGYDSTIRARLIAEVLGFVRAARKLPGVTRIALIGSLTTEKPEPQDADLLVTVDANVRLPDLAELGRKLRGHAQSFSRSADVFLADPQHEYLGRLCPWKQCGPGLRQSCDALHCGQRPYLHDDLNTLRLSTALIATPPLELWPEIVTRATPPDDIKFGLIAPLRAEKD
ncbi:MAG TPA: UPF0158 family protein [Anaerolineae bacterium]|nr:UPF0158 family protein [Anaerolineae bacterium]